MEVIKAFMKTKENGENIYKMLNAWLKNFRSILAFMKKEIKDTEKERERESDRKENAWRTVEQFLIVFLWTIRDQAIL